jgi:hypothetical protein
MSPGEQTRIHQLPKKQSIWWLILSIIVGVVIVTFAVSAVINRLNKPPDATSQVSQVIPGFFCKSVPLFCCGRPSVQPTSAGTYTSIHSSHTFGLLRPQ